MSEWWGAPVPRGTGPSGWWYWLAAGVALATAAATGVVGYARASDVIDQVAAYPPLETSPTAVALGEPGEYAVYREVVEPPDDGAPSSDPMIRVKGPTGELRVHASNASYGLGGTEARVVCSFHVTEPGDYEITVSETEGRLTFGKRLPSSPLYGFGRTVLASGAVLVACLVAVLVLAKVRHDRRYPEL